MKIAFFDSGLGGLSVLHHARKAIPRADFLFYADEDHVPYGEKSRADILRYVTEAFDFLVGEGADAIVVACNTATSVAIADMRRRYAIPIIGMEPAVKRALDLDGSRRVLVAATPVTVKGEKLRLLLSRIDRRHLVDCIALPRLVTFAEREEFRSESVTGYLREALAPFRLEDYSAFVLGCTHFNYFKDTLRALLPTNVCFVDGNAGAVRELIHELGGEAALPQAGESRTRCYYSGRPVTDEATLAHIARCMKRLDEVYALA